MPWDVDKAVNALRANLKLGTSKPPHQCAMYTRMAIEAGGAHLIRPPSHDAKDYGAGLIIAGFSPLMPGEAAPYQRGDVVIFQAVAGHPHGHMAMYDGAGWISDYGQATIYAAHAYKTLNGQYKIYRYGLTATPAGN